MLPSLRQKAESLAERLGLCYDVISLAMFPLCSVAALVRDTEDRTYVIC